MLRIVQLGSDPSLSRHIEAATLAVQASVIGPLGLDQIFQRRIHSVARNARSSAVIGSSEF